MKNSRSRHFSMLEVLLAIVVVGVGLAVLMLLFPVAARTANDTIDNNYVPMVANNFITYVKAQVDYADENRSSASVPNSFLSEALQDAGTVTGKLPAIPDVEALGGYSKDGWTIEHVDYKTTGSTSEEDEEPMSLYECKKGDKLDGCCVVIRGGYDSQTGKYTKVDFTAYAKLEKAKPDNFDASGSSEIVYYATPKWDNNSSYQYNALDNANTTFTDNFARVVLTVSWPLEVPPSARKSRVFVIEKASLL